MFSVFYLIVELFFNNSKERILLLYKLHIYECGNIKIYDHKNCILFLKKVFFQITLRLPQSTKWDSS